MRDRRPAARDVIELSDDDDELAQESNGEYTFRTVE